MHALLLILLRVCCSVLQCVAVRFEEMREKSGACTSANSVAFVLQCVVVYCSVSCL